MKYVIIIGLLLLTGCVQTSHYAFDFESNSSAQCSSACVDLMKEHKCIDAITTYTSDDINGVNIKSECSCFINNCIDIIKTD